MYKVKNGRNNRDRPVTMYFNRVPIASFDSIKTAGNLTGIDSGNISGCCSGNRGIAGGYEWEYTEEGLTGKFTLKEVTNYLKGLR